MEGTIRVESEMNRGSRFHFTLPFAVHADQPPSPSAAFGHERLQNLRILIADDNETSLRQLQTILQGCEQAPVAVRSGAAALAALEAARNSGFAFDLVLLDGMMPEMDGLATAEAIRTSEAFASTPIVLLSAATQTGISERCRELEISARLTKPVMKADVLRAIASALDDAPHLARTAAPRRGFDHPAAPLPLKILLVDDNPINRKVGMRLLEKRGHQILLAVDGRQAVSKYCDEVFDLILMDVHMPEMNGFDATREIRKIERERGGHTPIIAMTALAMQGDREACLAAGMDEYVSKPLRIEELTEKIDALLFRTPPGGLFAGNSQSNPDTTLSGRYSIE